MKKNIIICALVVALALVLTACGCQHEWYAATCETAKTCSLCGQTEGEALGHTWQEATCETAKTCQTCKVTEGEALGHSWEEATTEAPKTCTTCQLTEGTKLETDSRFTTAATKALQGQWSCEVAVTDEMMGLTGLGGMDCVMKLNFSNIGDMSMTMELKDVDEFLTRYKSFTEDMLYAEFAAMGMTAEQANEAMVVEYGLTVEEYVEVALESFDPNELLSAFNAEYVYYVEGDEICTAISWKTEFEREKFTLTDGELIIEGVTLEDNGETLVWTR